MIGPLDQEHIAGSLPAQIRELFARVTALEQAILTGLIEGDRFTAPGDVQCAGLEVTARSLLGLPQFPKLAMIIDTGTIRIASGYSWYVLSPETGTSDNLDTIDGGREGDIIILCADVPSTSIVVRDDQDNIKLHSDADFNMNSEYDRIMLQYDGSYWLELGRANNG